MIVRRLDQAINSKRRVTSKGWESVRLLLNDDNVGFSFHITTIYRGVTLEMHYKNHFESVYCIKGEGIIRLAETGATHIIEPGTIYVLDKNDRHVLQAVTEMTLACVFKPALFGDETHDDSGSYPDLSGKGN